VSPLWRDEVGAYLSPHRLCLVKMQRGVHPKLTAEHEQRFEGVADEGRNRPLEALGDPNRRDILRLLSEGDKPVSQIAAALPISRPAVSRHLRLLKEAGLVAEQARGTSRIYHLRGEGLRAVQEYLEQVWGEAAQRFRICRALPKLDPGPTARPPTAARCRTAWRSSARVGSVSKWPPPGMAWVRR